MGLGLGLKIGLGLGPYTPVIATRLILWIVLVIRVREVRPRVLVRIRVTARVGYGVRIIGRAG